MTRNKLVRNRLVYWNLILLVLGLTLYVSCSSHPKDYNLIVKIDSSVNVKNDAVVILNGVQIGKLENVIKNGDEKMLKIVIEGNKKVPRGAEVFYFINPVDIPYISMHYYGTEKRYLIPNDTLPNKAIYKRGLDSLKREEIKEKVKHLIDVLDTVAKKIDSNASGKNRRH